MAPPDAVAAVAVARKAGLPRNVVTLLEGESLFNDATSLVLLRVAVVGVAAGSLAWGPAIGQFAWAAAGGVLIGILLGLMLSFVRRYVDSLLASTALSLVTPFLAYLLGERFEASGVLTVVVTGLVLGHRSPFGLPPEVRLTLGATWKALQYVLEGSVFALIGLQLWAIIQGISLPAVIRMLHLPGDPAADAQRERAAARDEANLAIAARVEEVITAEGLPAPQAGRMRAWRPARLAGAHRAARGFQRQRAGTVRQNLRLAA